MKAFRFVVLAVTLAVLICSTASAQGKKKKSKGAQASVATAQDYQLLKKYRKATGRIVNFDPAKRTMTLRVEFQIPVLKKQNAGGNKSKNKNNNNANRNRQRQAQQRAQRQRQARNRNRNRNRGNNRGRRGNRGRGGNNAAMQRQRQMMQRYAQMQRAQMQQYQRQVQQLVQRAKQNAVTVTYQKASKDFELFVASNVVVRRASLPFEYDDKGNVKEYTKEEIAKLRGKDKSKPGFPAAYEDLLMGQGVTIVTSTGDPNLLNSERLPEVGMVVILTDSLDIGQNDGKKRKKN